MRKIIEYFKNGKKLQELQSKYNSLKKRNRAINSITTKHKIGDKVYFWDASDKNDSCIEVKIIGFYTSNEDAMIMCKDKNNIIYLKGRYNLFNLK